jgi:hypothetical protein
MHMAAFKRTLLPTQSLSSGHPSGLLEAKAGRMCDCRLVSRLKVRGAVHTLPIGLQVVLIKHRNNVAIRSYICIYH